MTRPIGKQREDLARFGHMVQRQSALRLITLRNSGVVTHEEFDRLVELLDLTNAGRVEILLDSFDAQVDIARALNELEPIPTLMRRRLVLGTHQTQSAVQQWLGRVEAAIRYLKADPR